MKLELPFLHKTGIGAGLAGEDGQQLIDVLNGKYYNRTLQGRVFSQSCTPLGLAIPIYTATALVGGMPIWNPAGSGVKVVPLKYVAGRASGTAAFFAVGLMARNGMGSVIATGAQCTAFAETTPVNGKLSLVNGIAGGGGGVTSAVKSSNAGTVTVTAAVAAEWIQTLGATGVEADATTNGISLIDYDFDGIFEVYPGTMVWIGATKASVALYAQTLTWTEILL